MTRFTSRLTTITGLERRGECEADGTGTAYAWGGEFDRRWRVQGQNRICLTLKPLLECYRVEESLQPDPGIKADLWSAFWRQAEISLHRRLITAEPLTVFFGIEAGIGGEGLLRKGSQKSA